MGVEVSTELTFKNSCEAGERHALAAKPLEKRREHVVVDSGDRLVAVGLGCPPVPRGLMRSKLRVE